MSVDYWYGRVGIIAGQILDSACICGLKTMLGFVKCANKPKK